MHVQRQALQYIYTFKLLVPNRFSVYTFPGLIILDYIFGVLIFTAGVPFTISTGAAVGVTFTVAIGVGFVAGLLVMYLITRCKNLKHNEGRGQTQIPQQIVAGPVYEEVSTPKENIELETNQAYGPVGR